MIFGVIVAGGVGARLGADMPKQFLQLADRPIIIHTLDTFLKVRSLRKFIWGFIRNGWSIWHGLFRNIFRNQERSRVHLVPGGAERNETIMNVIEQIEQDFGNRNLIIFITQDGVRSFRDRRLIREHVNAVLQYDAVDTAIPAVDTIILSEDGDL